MVPGRDTEPGVPVRQAGRLGHDADVGQQGDSQAGTHRNTVDGRDDRLAGEQHLLDVGPGVSPLHQRRVVVVGHLLDHVQVASGRERRACAGHHRRSHPGIIVHDRPYLGELAVHPDVRRIEDVGSVQGDDDDSIWANVEREMFEIGVLGRPHGTSGRRRTPWRAPIVVVTGASAIASEACSKRSVESSMSVNEKATVLVGAVTSKASHGLVSPALPLRETAFDRG